MDNNQKKRPGVSEADKKKLNAGNKGKTPYQQLPSGGLSTSSDSGENVPVSGTTNNSSTKIIRRAIPGVFDKLTANKEKKKRYQPVPKSDSQTEEKPQRSESKQTFTKTPTEKAGSEISTKQKPANKQEASARTNDAASESQGKSDSPDMTASAVTSKSELKQPSKHEVQPKAKVPSTLSASNALKPEGQKTRKDVGPSTKQRRPLGRANEVGPTQGRAQRDAKPGPQGQRPLPINDPLAKNAAIKPIAPAATAREVPSALSNTGASSDVIKTQVEKPTRGNAKQTMPPAKAKERIQINIEPPEKSSDSSGIESTMPERETNRAKLPKKQESISSDHVIQIVPQAEIKNQIASETLPPTQQAHDQKGTSYVFKDKSFQLLINTCATERTVWSKTYARDSQFKKKVDFYRQKRRELFHSMETADVSKEEIDLKSQELAGLLALAFNFVNADSKDWKAEIRERCMRGGREYATPSVNAFWGSSIPGIARAAVFLGFQAAKIIAPEHELEIAQIQGAAYIGYFVLQTAATFQMPLWNAYLQSAAVARQSINGPAYMPNVKSEKRVSETGEEIDLKNPDALKKLMVKDLMLSDEAKHRIDNNERAIGEIYKRSVMFHNSGGARAWRAGLNIAAASSGFISNLGTSINLNSSWQIGLGTMTLGILSAQPAIYSYQYKKASGEDSIAKLATFFQLLALNGTGNLDDEHGVCVPTKIDNMLKGPVRLRLDFIKAILEYDRKVYQTALFSIVLHDELVLLRPNAPDEFKELSFTFLKTKFAALKSPATRLEYLTNAIQQDGNDGRRDKLYSLLALYERNELSIVAADRWDISFLLSPKSSLSTESTAMLYGSLKYGSLISDAEGNRTCDDKLCEKKADVERKVDITSVHQVTQKLGQAYEYVLAGSAGPNAVKSVFNLVQGFLLIVNPEQFRKVASEIALAQAPIQILASIAAIFLGYSFQEHVAQKNMFRDRDKNKHGVPNSGFLNSYAILNMSRMRGIVSCYTTLAARPLDDSMLPAYALHYKPEISLLNDMWKQMTTAKKSKFFTYWKEKGGKLNANGEIDLEGPPLIEGFPYANEQQAQLIANFAMEDLDIIETS